MEDELIEVITTKKNNIPTKKKKSHMFEIYISKVLKQISTVNGITTNAKQQLNSAICHILKYICSLTFKLVASSKKKTITLKEIENSLKIVLQGELLLCALKEGNKSCENISSSKIENINSSRQNKACIIFPPSIVEKYLRNFGSSTIMVSSLAPVFLASVIEFISFEILDLSINFCKENKHNRITIRDLELSVRSDLELNNLFNKLNLSFLGGGVVPYIHPSLFNKIIKKKKNATTTAATQHRFRYGTMAIKNIRKNQKISNTLILAKTTFEKIIRNSFKKQQIGDSSSNVKISKEVFVVIQYFIEQYIVKILNHSNYLSIHSGRVKVIPNDILLYLFFNNEQPNPYIAEDVKLFSLEDDFNNDTSLQQSIMSSSTISDNSLLNNSDENYEDNEDDEEQITIEQFTMS